MANSGRLHPRDHFWDDKRKPFIIGVTFVFVLLQLLFLGNSSYIYGLVYKSSYKVHDLDVLNVNLDVNTSTIQNSVNAAYSSLQGSEFFTLKQESSSDYPTIGDARQAVCKGPYWAAIVISEGSSSRLSAALDGGQAANDYDSTQAINLIYNSAYYSAESLGDVIGNLDTLVSAASAAYGSVAPNTIQTLNTTSAAAVNAYRNPISSNVIDIMPTNQGSRVLYNTVSMVLPIVQQFFFLMALNGLSTKFKLYTSLQIHHSILCRIVLSTLYTFISSLGFAGYLWAFREDWNVNSNQFALTWMVVWLYMLVNFAVIDAATGFIPMTFLPFFIITWIIINVSSSLYPTALSPGFYHWSMALPAYNTYNLLVDVWSSGCNPVAYRALPILFSWVVAGTALCIFAMYRRCAAAAKAEEEEQARIQKMIDEKQLPSWPGTPSTAPDSEKDENALERGESAQQYVQDMPYPDRVREEVSQMGIRMPFADMVESLGSSKLERSRTMPERPAQ